MRTRLYSNPDPEEIDDWFDAADIEGTSLEGVAVIVADRGDGSLAGFVEIGSRNYAEGWYVDPDVRRTGMGANLLKAAETWALKHGFSDIASDTELDNEISLQAMLRWAFKR